MKGNTGKVQGLDKSSTALIELLRTMKELEEMRKTLGKEISCFC